MRWTKRAGLVVLLWLLAGVTSWAGNTHSGTGDIAEEQRAWWGDTLIGGYVVSGCRITSIVGAGGPIPECRAYTLNTTTPRQLEYVEDLTSRTINFSSGPGTYWLIVHTSISATIPGWTRLVGTHYLWQNTPAQPAVPNQAVLLATFTFNTSMALTAATDLRPSNPIESNVLRVTDPLFGAVPNDGLDDAPAVQAALAAAQRGNMTVRFPAGVYDLLTQQCPVVQGYQTSTAVCVAEASNLVVEGGGATLRAGANVTRLLGVYGPNSTHVHVRGFRMIGHTEVISEHKHGIVVGHNASAVRLTHNYLTNFLGDCILVGGNLQNGTLLGFTTTFIYISENTCKVRVGNGISSALSGTASRLAMAVTDARYVIIDNNLIFGGIDLEPDVDLQWVYQLIVRNNTFVNGPVTPQASIGPPYHYDEPVQTPGLAGTIIPGTISYVGIPGSPNAGEVVIRDNMFERGYITCGVGPYRCSVIGNTFHEGLIELSSTAGTGSLDLVHVADNLSTSPYPGETTFIKLKGLVTFGTFINNVTRLPGGYVIASSGAGTGDGGRNIFNGNINRGVGAAGVLNFNPLPTSVVASNVYERQLTMNSSITLRETFNRSLRLVPQASPPTAPEIGDLYMDDSLALCWYTQIGVWTKISGGGTCS